jgi:hypothetical protein
MKYVVWDLSNNGVIASSLTLAGANALRAGLIDTEVSHAFPGLVPSYNQLEIGVQPNHLRWNVSTGDVRPLLQHEINDVYLEKKRLAEVRLPAINKVVLFAIVAPKKTTVYHSTMAEVDFEVSLSRCDVMNGQYDNCITEYAHINNIPVIEAYRQLKLRSENFRSERMRIYSYYDYFIGKINLIEKQSDIEAFYTDMDLILRKDLFVKAHFFGDKS